MAADTGQRRDPKAPNAAFGRAGSVLAAAWSEFFARAFEAGGRTVSDAILQALSPAERDGSSSGGIEALIERYRQVLGETASLLPAVGRYLTGLAKPVSGGTNRLLFRVSTRETQDAGVQWQIAAREDQPDWPLRILFTTQTTIEALESAAKTGLRPDSATLADLVFGAAVTIECRNVRDLAVLLDELKYEFRRRGPSALPEIRDELRALLDPELDQYYPTLTVLKHALGEQVMERIVAERILSKYAGALEGGGSALGSSVLEWIQDRFRSVGIVLSDRVSAVAARHDGLILDHLNDAVYEVRYFADHYDVYGLREGRRYNVSWDGHDVDVLLPVRVLDASQGFVVWSIDKRTVQEQLDCDRTDLEAWDTGAGKTPVVLFIVDQREGDLGAYAEIVLGCLATPPGQPLAVGLWTLGEVPINSPLAKAANEAIWGYRKVDARIEIDYRDSSVICELRGTSTRDDGEPCLRLVLPRGGEAASMPLPLLAYTVKPRSPETQSSLHRTVITRSGSGEQVRGGGTGVSLVVGNRETFGLCDNLRHLGLIDDYGVLARRPLFTVWTERVTAEIGAPALVVPPSDDDS